jgi:type VI secretion system protein ImpJ
MLLGPQHFQTQSRYFEDTLWFLHARTRQNPWGVLHLSLDQEALPNGRAVLKAGSGIMPDGLIFDLLDSDPLPPPLELNSVFAIEDSGVILHLAIPARRENGLDCDLADGSGTRYGAVERTVGDDAYGQDTNSVCFARKNLFLVSQTELKPGMTSIAIARVVRDGKGGFVPDTEFIPSCLRLAASERLVTIVQRLVRLVDEKVTRLRSERRGPKAMDQLSAGLDVSSYWLLHCLSATIPALSNHLASRMSHPEDIYRDLARLAGALSTFSPESSPQQIPAYLHEDLTTTFRGLEQFIRNLLDKQRPVNIVRLAFEKEAPYFYKAGVKDDRCLQRARWILGIRSSMPDSLLLRQAPRLVKVCSQRGVQTLVRKALPGLELLHLPVPPSALGAQADMHYFSISLDGLCWQDIQNTRHVGVYIPGEIGEAVFELTVITENPA